MFQKNIGVAFDRKQSKTTVIEFQRRSISRAPKIQTILIRFWKKIEQKSELQQQTVDFKTLILKAEKYLIR